MALRTNELRYSYQVPDITPTADIPETSIGRVPPQFKLIAGALVNGPVETVGIGANTLTLTIRLGGVAILQQVFDGSTPFPGANEIFHFDVGAVIAEERTTTQDQILTFQVSQDAGVDAGAYTLEFYFKYLLSN